MFPIVLPMSVAVSTVSIPVALETSLAVNTDPEYDGAIEFTPTAEAQTVLVGGYRVSQNITINPIPSNYGLITWNGSLLTVS